MDVATSSRPPINLILCSLAVILLLSLYHLYQKRNTESHLPPLARGYPVIGNAIEVGKAASQGKLHLQIQEYARRHGEIVRVKIGPFTEYFLNSDVAVKELFDRASAQTAERPRWIVSNEQICNKLNVLLLNGSDLRWKHQRKAIHSGLTSVSKADAGLPHLHFETLRFMNDVATNSKISESSHALWTAIGRYTYSTFATQTFGMDIPDLNDPVISYIYDTGIAQIQGTLPGQHLVDILPILDKLPLILKPWERKGRARFQRDMSWSRERLHRIQNALADSEQNELVIKEAFLPSVLLDPNHLGFPNLDEAAYLSLMLIIGAADTSRISTWSFLEAMLLFPDVQQKAYSEIEHVLLPGQIPEYSDLDRIPYIKSLMKELWRWRPPVALGHPHTTTQDLRYKTYTIPKGARLHLNAWAIGHDPNRHLNPEVFDPDRYQNDHTNTMQSINSKDVSRRDHFAFGSGRRVCPGYHVAERSLAVAIMRILWGFEIKVKHGVKWPVDPAEYHGDMPGNAGEGLPVTLRVRSESKKKVIEEMLKREMATRPNMMRLSD